jgi:hypothetical protein
MNAGMRLQDMAREIERHYIVPTEKMEMVSPASRPRGTSCS